VEAQHPDIELRIRKKALEESSGIKWRNGTYRKQLQPQRDIE